MQEYQAHASRHRRQPLPSGHWAAAQRWNHLLFAHWPVAASTIAALLPAGLVVDCFQGSAWLSVVLFNVHRNIFWNVLPPISSLSRFSELDLYTYVRDQYTGTPGFFYLSRDANNLLTVMATHMFSQRPCHWAAMQQEQRAEQEFFFYSRRRFSSPPVIFQARYRGVGPTLKLAQPRRGTLEYFLTERCCLFTCNRAGRLHRSEIHRVRWPLEEAEAVIERNDLAAACGIALPDQPPVLHYSRRLALYIWPAELVRPARLAQPVTATVTPSG